jgi:hypothetical protein
MRSNVTKMLFDNTSMQCYKQYNLHVRTFLTNQNALRIYLVQHWPTSNEAKFRGIKVEGFATKKIILKINFRNRTEKVFAR